MRLLKIDFVQKVLEQVQLEIRRYIGYYNEQLSDC